VTLQAPAFWWRPRPGPAALALAPLAALYGAVAGSRMAKSGAGVGVPVVCVGNFVVGGAGKTPLAIEIARQMIASGHSPGFVSRGYGRRTVAPGPIPVDIARHGAGDVGDEPLLLARAAPCFVAADRVAAARAAVAAGSTIVIMDDGLQSRSLAQDAAIAVVDGGVGIGNGLCLPAGPLRAPLARQWGSVELVVVIGAGAPGGRVAAEAERRGLPVMHGAFEPSERAVAELRGRRLLAFSGIGRPEKFFRTLRDAGLDVAREIGFPDHHVYRARDLDGLRGAAAAAGAALVTTDKDRVRLPAGFPAAVLPVRLRFADPVPLEDLLGRLLSRAR